MKRIFSFFLSALLAVVFTTAHAQQNIFIWKGGNISVKSAANIDSITTSAGSWLFDIRTSAATSVTRGTLKASVTVYRRGQMQYLSQTPEVGVCFSLEKATPTYADEHCYLGTSLRSYDFTLYDLDPGTTYYYRAYVKLGDEVFYGNVKSITTSGEKPTSPYILINGHRFVDLGLPSGLLWARTNVGASSSIDDGDYFAWGETSSKSSYDWSTCKWGSSCSKYNSSDGKTTLDAEDDAATVNWGVPCRMPDFSDFEELYNNCYWKSCSTYSYDHSISYGRSGYLVTGPNGNTIFFPASGQREDEDLYDHNSGGFYWSRSLSTALPSPSVSKSLVFNTSRFFTANADFFSGFTVRPVAEK